MPLKGKNILITGAAGFIGFHLSCRLLKDGAQVVGIDNLNDYYDPRLKQMRLDVLAAYPSFRFTKLDIADKAALEEVFSRTRPSVVVNLAAQAGVRYSIEHPDVYINSNVVGFFNVLECCRRHPVEHLLYASSSSVYGANKKVPFSVNDPVDHPISLYAATKKSDELMAYTYSHLYDIPATGLRFFTVYGPYGRPDMAYFKFADKIMGGGPIQIYNHGDMYRDFTYIDDIVEGIVRLLEHVPQPDDATGARYKVYNIGNSRPEKLMDFIQTLEQVLGREAEKEFLPMQPGDVYSTYADMSELERDVGFKPETTIQSGLSRFAHWYRTEWLTAR